MDRSLRLISLRSDCRSGTASLTSWTAICRCRGSNCAQIRDGGETPEGFGIGGGWNSSGHAQGILVLNLAGEVIRSVLGLVFDELREEFTIFSRFQSEGVVFLRECKKSVGCFLLLAHLFRLLRQVLVHGGDGPDEMAGSRYTPAVVYRGKEENRSLGRRLSELSGKREQNENGGSFVRSGAMPSTGEEAS